jgi:hypothetical protein
MSKTCETCKFCVVTKEAFQLGECRRHAPAHNPNSANHWLTRRFPGITFSTSLLSVGPDWCGDYELRTKEEDYDDTFYV